MSTQIQKVKVLVTQCFIKPDFEKIMKHLGKIDIPELTIDDKIFSKE